MRPSFGSIVLALGAVVLLDCATLDPLAGRTCGNGVVDANEDCDSFAPSHFSTGQCGGAGEGAAACHLKCTNLADCPDGWGCSVAGVCRAPTGEFLRLGEALSAGVESMIVGDLDGDRRMEVIGSGPQSLTHAAKVRVHYFGDGAALAHVNSLAAAVTSPAVHDFNGDGVDDFAFGLDLGAFGIMTGQRDRSLVPAIFPSQRFARSDGKMVPVFGLGGRSLPTGAASAMLFAGRLTVGGAVVDALSSIQGDEPYQHELPVGLDGILGDPVWAPLLPDDPTSTCGEIALALNGVGPNGVIQVFSPCAPAAASTSRWASGRAPRTIAPPSPLEGSLFIGDADEDGKLDVVFGGRHPTGRLDVYVARGTGSGFDVPALTKLTSVPIAAGDIDGDALVDFVLPTGLELTGGPAISPDAGAVDGGGSGGGGGSPVGVFVGGYQHVDPGRRVQWTTARIGNLNGDGRKDVIAAASGLPDIDFLGAVPGGFVSSTITTAGAVARLAVGDFDGDAIEDVGFVEKRGQAGITDVAIAYGRPNGAPEAARTVGRTTEVIAFGAASTVRDPSGLPQGLVLCAREPASDGGLPDLAWSVILGSGDRQPLAPLLFDDALAKDPETNPDIARFWVPFEVRAAAVQDPTRVDLIALAVGLRYSRSNGEFVFGSHPAGVWVAKGVGGTSFDPPRGVETVGGFVVTARGDVAFDVKTVVGDIDNPRDGLGEFVVLNRVPRTGLVVQVARPESGAPVTLATLAGETQRPDAPVALYDVDGDGNLDLVTLLGTADDEKVIIFYNDANGGFVASEVVVPLDEGEVARGFTLLTTAGAQVHGAGQVRRELAVLTTRRVVLAAPSSADRTVLDVRAITGGESATMIAPTAIAAGDFDGDGVPDLAVADGGALRILRQLPKVR